ncbi:MAG: GTPase HflX [Ardenticatenia bacterium]|nr:MAG: GTPase HflX [Ardenticatenia bacterium]
MAQQYYVPNQPERAFLVGVERKGEHSLWTIEDSLEELAQLARTAGMEVVGRTWQRLDHPNPATYIGKGKVEELKLAVAETGARTVIFDDELSPAQQRNLERALGEDIKVIDRTVLILDIFAQHARTREGQLQVELAQYRYRLPRLTRMWTHLARQAGGRAGGATGGVGLRGPGETQLEVDRREIRRRITHLQRELEAVRAHREQYRRRRRREGVPVVALVGYTNAGKSTLLNALTNANVLAEDKLFATLDPTTRRVRLPEGREVLFTDTVGFIQKLPPDLVAAFRATLEEIHDAHILVHVVDISHPMAAAQIEAVESVLDDLGVAHKPIIQAWNKIDRVADRDAIEEEAARDPDIVVMSARTGEGLDHLLERVQGVLQDLFVEVDVLLPYAHGALLHEIHEQGTIESEEHTADGTRVHAYVPAWLAARLSQLNVS